MTIDAAAYWMGFACFVGFACCVFLFPILAIFRTTRSAAGAGYVVCSFVFGGTLWIMCALTVYESWGLAALLSGLMLIGVGVLPMALIIFATHAQWALFAEIILIGALTIGVRMLGVWLAERAL